MITDIDRFIANLHAAFGKAPRSETATFYRDKLSKWPLTDVQWSKALSRIVADIPDSRLPTLAQIYPFLRYELRGRTENTEPVFRTWHDREGRSWASPISGSYRSIVPTDQDLERWKHEKCTPEEGREAFRKAYLDAGGKLEALAQMQRALLQPKPERSTEIRQIADYDDSPEALEGFQ